MRNLAILALLALGGCLDPLTADEIAKAATACRSADLVPVMLHQSAPGVVTAVVCETNSALKDQGHE